MNHSEAAAAEREVLKSILMQEAEEEEDGKMVAAKHFPSADGDFSMKNALRSISLPPRGPPKCQGCLYQT